MPGTTWNPSDKSANITLTSGNLLATVAAGGFQGARSVYSTATGKYYWEYLFGPAVTIACGIGLSTVSLTASGANGVAGAALVNIIGTVFINSTSSAAALGSMTTSIAGIAVDLNGQQIWFRKGAAGNWNNSGAANPATGVGGLALTFVGGGGSAAFALMMATSASTGTITANFGDTAFSGVVPSGFASGFSSTAPIIGGDQVRVMMLT